MLYGPLGGVPAFYDALVEDKAQRSEVLRRVIEKLEPGGRILDLGCGTGIFEELISTNPSTFTQVVGIDISPEMIEISKKKVVARQVGFIQGDFMNISELLSPDIKFDYILAIAINRYLLDARRLFSCLSEYLNIDGQIILYTLKPSIGTKIKVLGLWLLTLGIFNVNYAFLAKLKKHIDVSKYEIHVEDLALSTEDDEYLQSLQLVRLIKKTQ
jgi:SAM-dependent methyltransferase